MTEVSMSVTKMKIARVSKDLNQQQLAEICEVTRQTIGMIEAGKFNPSLALCIKIAKALDSSLDELFWPEDEKEN
jgi:putative transcriptional regulator